MQPLLYTDLVPWYRLVDPVADHADEAELYCRALESAAAIRPETLLELGAGAGNNAFHLKQRFRCTLTDISAAMRALARQQNPDCEVLHGDMRSLRLGRTFDVVLVADAVMYMTTEADLRAAIETAFAHTRPGGAALFAPDCVRETLCERCELLQAEDGGRALRGLEWAWDPDPTDSIYLVEYAFLLRDGHQVQTAHDRHLEGVFSMQTWLELLRGSGYQAEPRERLLEGEDYPMFVCRRP
jgi:SAM-dependent methyltransferase